MPRIVQSTLCLSACLSVYLSLFSFNPCGNLLKQIQCLLIVLMMRKLSHREGRKLFSILQRRRVMRRGMGLGSPRDALSNILVPSTLILKQNHSAVPWWQLMSRKLDLMHMTESFRGDLGKNQRSLCRMALYECRLASSFPAVWFSANCSVHPSVSFLIWKLKSERNLDSMN